jgi:hypothetical protein
MSLKLRLRFMKHNAERGFTTVTLMGVLAVGGMLTAAGFAAVDPDISLSREDQDYKQSYGAAEAGLQWYLNRLGQDNSFYVRCANVPRPNATEYSPVNQPWNQAGSDPRIWRRLPGEEADYTVELLPAPGYPNCIEGNQYSMVDTGGNLRLRVTGRSRDEYRTVRATLRRKNFIDFIYFTQFETLDPAAYSGAGNVATATSQCSTFRAARTSFCQEIQFAPADVISGPLHTNDNLRVCGNATFGRNRRDSIEVSGQPSYVNSGSCTATPNFQGTLVSPADQLGMPPSNAAIRSVALPGYVFSGRTDITLNGSSMTVTTYNTATTPVTPVTRTLALPSNGVIYAANTSCNGGFIRSQTYSDPRYGCGDIWLRGRYDQDLTIAADNDIVVRDDVTRGPEGVLLGLIANNFVRVYHPVDFTQTGGPGGCENTGNWTDTRDLRLDAAMLTLAHSFIVDNWHCGSPLGDLSIFGAIAQRFRGTVGTGGSSGIATGYRKDYVYNDRLRYREPPFFLDPVKASWRISRETEQVPAVDGR